MHTGLDKNIRLPALGQVVLKTYLPEHQFYLPDIQLCSSIRLHFILFIENVYLPLGQELFHAACDICD